MLRRCSPRLTGRVSSLPTQTQVLRRSYPWRLSMNKPIVAVMGATGAQGGSVVDALLKAGKWKVRALTRDPKSARCDALREKGVEVVKANAGNKEEIEKAFQVRWSLN